MTALDEFETISALGVPYQPYIGQKVDYRRLYEGKCKMANCVAFDIRLPKGAAIPF